MKTCNFDFTLIVKFPSPPFYACHNSQTAYALSHSLLDGRFTFNTAICYSDYEYMLETDLAPKSFPGKLLMKFRVSTAYLAEWSNFVECVCARTRKWVSEWKRDMRWRCENENRKNDFCRFLLFSHTPIPLSFCWFFITHTKLYTHTHTHIHEVINT